MGYFCPPGSGSTDLIESGSNPDLDPKHWHFSSVLQLTFNNNLGECSWGLSAGLEGGSLVDIR